jgi:hypothetical protein
VSKCGRSVALRATKVLEIAVGGRVKGSVTAGYLTKISKRREKTICCANFVVNEL